MKPNYNLLEHGKSYSKTSDSLWNYYRDEPYAGNINSISNSKPVDYKASITGRSQATDIDSNVETPVPLIFFNIFYNCVI